MSHLLQEDFEIAEEAGDDETGPIGAREQYISSVSLFLFFRLPCNRCFCLPIVLT